MSKHTRTISLDQLAAMGGCTPEIAMEIAKRDKLPFARRLDNVTIYPEDVPSWLSALSNARARLPT